MRPFSLGMPRGARACSAGGDRRNTRAEVRMANAKSIGWAIYVSWICDLAFWLLVHRPRLSI